ncbi:Protein CBG08000 [Caenorhabditis briggsae]|uniref:Protein CBG08000 n=1 Tax=Caenorhabditis briggsae TaxID=6238 RepID=A8X5J7_CAEBR|nr:Protein CBG08000 [Caenorhabditis briggsae]CAP27908.1 Protein CBG08000 [Caenorhabditis briggsae]
MHKWRPVVTIRKISREKLEEGFEKEFRLEETCFIAVTIYHNRDLVDLKIGNNPMASAFREQYLLKKNRVLILKRYQSRRRSDVFPTPPTTPGAAAGLPALTNGITSPLQSRQARSPLVESSENQKPTVNRITDGFPESSNISPQFPMPAGFSAPVNGTTSHQKPVPTTNYILGSSALGNQPPGFAAPSNISPQFPMPAGFSGPTTNPMMGSPALSNQPLPTNGFPAPSTQFSMPSYQTLLSQNLMLFRLLKKEMSHHNRGPYRQNHQPMPRHHPARHQQLPEEQDEPIDVPNAIANMPGYRQLEPTSALESIAASSCLMVVQCLEPIEMWTGIETPNRYIVHDMYMRRILYAHEESDYWDRSCDRNRRSFDLHMFDNRRQRLMSSSRYGGGSFTCSPDVLETWHRGNSIGILSRSTCDHRFYLRIAGCPTEFAVVAPDGAQSSPACRSRHTLPFPIYIQGGAKVGEIVRLDPGYLEWVSYADTYMIHSFYQLLHPLLHPQPLRAHCSKLNTSLTTEPSEQWSAFFSSDCSSVAFAILEVPGREREKRRRHGRFLDGRLLLQKARLVTWRVEKEAFGVNLGHLESLEKARRGRRKLEIQKVPLDKPLPRSREPNLGPSPKSPVSIL